jgi:hypothetical protein
MTCVFTPQIALFGSADTVALFSDNNDIATFYSVPCELTIRDNFAMSALSALGSDASYALAFSRSDITQGVIDSYYIADLMLAERLK